MIICSLHIFIKWWQLQTKGCFFTTTRLRLFGNTMSNTSPVLSEKLLISCLKKQRTWLVGTVVFYSHIIRTYCRQHFPKHFVDKKSCSFVWNFTEVVFSQEFKRHSNIGAGNGLAPNKRHAIALAKVDKDIWLHMESLGHSELKINIDGW